MNVRIEIRLTIFDEQVVLIVDEQVGPVEQVARPGDLRADGFVEGETPAGAVLTCSALKVAYRDRLRAAAPGLPVQGLRWAI